MKKLITMAVMANFSLPVAAWAQSDNSGIELTVGGYFRGYMTHTAQDTSAGNSERNIDFIRDTEIHLNGKTTLDNGLTVGMHVEATADMGDGFGVDKSYLYVSGDKGRVNMGGNNGVAYILQVAAPAADTNYDGARQYVRAVNYSIAPTAFAGLSTFDLEYAQDTTGSSDKISYLTPLYQGFQAGVSYTPDVQASAFAGNQESTTASRGLAGVATDDVAGAYGSAWEIAGRYEGKIDDIEFKLGAGYIHIDLEEAAPLEDDLTAWNVAAAGTYNGFSIGVVYTENDQGTEPEKESHILVLGADYKSGPWKFGTSWYKREDMNFSGTTDLDTDRYSGGVTYTYGPGMTLRGSVHYIDHKLGINDMDATTFLIGSQVSF